MKLITGACAFLLSEVNHKGMSHFIFSQLLSSGFFPFWLKVEAVVL